ncbi:hypothetical protein EZV73_15140 [Acidaminobacter sp. JC074]|uniref:hypothetical protein n=1 Tax=Acidaminobacter sp. JC074 TaxID=2530199 RepID=UPI001F112A39|nr:hypothetical protein [Acidaminobacter sp. JC074]MCH4888929.1 hypothetical protein [Acidaminobacter sp. JC074]
MRYIGNIILIPIKFILVVAYLITTVGVILSVIIDSFSTAILSRFISLCFILLVLSIFLQGASLTDNISFTAIVISYVLIIIFTLIPFLLKELQELIKNGLAFWL